MARIVGVTFETESGKVPGRFTIPKRVADFLGIKDGDAIELAITAEGIRVEAAAQLQSGLDVTPVSRPSSEPLAQLPANAPLTVTVWHPGDAEAAPGPSRQWDRPTFIDALVDSGLSGESAEEILSACLEWADHRNLIARWGNANMGSILIHLIDDHLPSNVGHKQRFFALWTSGSVELQFNSMAPPFDTAERRAELQGRLNAIDGVSVPRSIGYPSIPMRDLAIADRLDGFLATYDWVLAETTDWLGRQLLAAGTLTLHEAMSRVLRDRPNGLSAGELADAINRHELYRKRDGSPVHLSQIHARAANYGSLFEKANGRIRLRRATN